MASRSQTDQEQQPPSLEEVLADLALKIDRLKTLYEQYFMGIEKLEPQVSRKEVTRVMLTLQQQYIRNTALRFKFNTMLQKWNLYVTYWNRVLREIENGTYVRHLAKVKRKADAEGREVPAEMAAAKRRASPSGVFEAPSLDTETDVNSGRIRANTDDDELEQVWDRLTGLDPKRLPPPTPPPGSLQASFSAARPVPRSTPSSGPLSLDRPTPTGTPIYPPGPPASPAGTPPAPAGASTQRPPHLPPPPPRATVPPPTQAGGSLKLPPPAPPARLPPAPPGASAAARPPALPVIPGMSEPELRALHQRYVDAQKKSGAPGAAVRYETLVNSLAKQVPNVLRQPGVSGVRFDVSVQDGKPVLKAIPQKK